MAQLEVLALDQSTPQIRAPGASDTYTCPRALSVTGTITGTSRLIANSTHSVPEVLVQRAMHLYIAPSGTMGNNGEITLGTALPRNFSEGLYLYLPANAISAGSAAGWYWTIMSSTTAGTVYNNTYSADVDVMPARVTSPTAFVTTGPGAYTGSTTEVTYLQKTVSGGSLGPNGSLFADIRYANNNSANNKAFRAYLGETILMSITNTTTIFARYPFAFYNEDSEAVNNSTNYAAYSTYSVYPPSHTAVNTAVDQVFKLAGQNTISGANYIGMETVSLIATYGA